MTTSDRIAAVTIDAPPAEALRQRAERDAADDRADIVDDGDQADLVRGKAVLHPQEGRIKVLRAVAEEVERGHQQHGVDAEPPVRLQDRERVAACVVVGFQVGDSGTLRRM